MFPSRSKVVRAFCGKYAILLLALIALLLLTPLILDGGFWSFVLGVSAGGVLVAGLHATNPGKRTLAIGLFLATIDLASNRVAAATGFRWILILQALLWFSSLAYVVFVILERILSTARVTVETLQAALCVYLLLGFLWVFIFALVDLCMPGEFRADGAHIAWTDLSVRRAEFVRLYLFSFGSLTTVGYGEMPHVGGLARMAANLEAMTGQLYLALLIARLVGAHLSQGPPNEQKEFGGDLWLDKPK
jgi:hypothetical protein